MRDRRRGHRSFADTTREVVSEIRQDLPRPCIADQARQRAEGFGKGRALHEARRAHRQAPEVVPIRWPDGVTCRRCGRAEPRFLASRRIWQCKSLHDHRSFSIKTGTIFEDSPLGLEKWLPAAWIICNDEDRVSSYNLARALGITQPTAWSMLDRIRRAYRPPAPYERFVAFMKRLIAVPKSEVDNARRS